MNGSLGMMRKKSILLSIILFLVSCASLEKQDRKILLAENFIDAFYSFEKYRLEAFLDTSKSSAPIILYYQGWAEGGNYEVLNRKPCVMIDPEVVSCSITVKDDPMLALGIDFNVTDTFTLTFTGNKLISVETSSNDLQVYHDAGAWVMKELPELVSLPCKGFFDGGPTPADCARAMTKGYARFAISGDFPDEIEIPGE